jgi:hypothetical protein
MTALARPGAAEREALGRWLARLDEAAARLPPPPGIFLVLTPLGLARGCWLLGALRELGVVRRAVRWLVPWSRLSTAIQVRGRDPAALERALVFEALWRAQGLPDEAEAWLLPAEAHGVVAANKRSLRRELPNRHVEVPGLLSRAASLHALHFADAGEELAEARRLLAALALLSR